MKLDDGRLVYCASCFRQDLDLRHVDFEADYDGPVLDFETYKVHAQDLIICEQCLKEAGQLIGMVVDDNLRQENKELGEALEVRVQEVKQLHKVVDDLQNALNHLSDKKIQKAGVKV